MPLPLLENWEGTRDSLHQTLQILNVVKVQHVAPERNHLHHSLSVTAQGLTTGMLDTGGELTLNLAAAQLAYHTSSATISLPAVGTSVPRLAQGLIDGGLAFNAEKLSDSGTLAINTQAAHDYAAALYTIYTAMARFRAGLYGMMTPIVLWPHHFDISFLWFATPEDDENKAHLNFGFSPGDGAERPYFYITAYPLPDGLTDTPLTAPAHWNASGWAGVRVEYDDLRALPDVEAAIESVLREVYRLLAPLMVQSTR